MARYNREFLVPYLHNICALHLATQKIDQKIEELNKEIKRLKEGQYVPVPSCPEEPRKFTCMNVGCLSFGLFLVWGCVMAFIWTGEFDFGMSILYLLMGAIGLGCINNVVSGYRYEKEAFEKGCAQFKIDYKRRMEIMAENQKWLDRVPAVTEERNAWRRERSRVQKLLQQAYDVNIIPRHYRDIYPAVYLYDWFRSSQESDLAMALNMYVLEEIKAKLDRIIYNQSEIILNQYIQEANRRKAMEQRSDHHRQLMSKLDRISAQNEERNNYLRMIESTSAADAYFSAADYFRDL